MEKGTKVRIVSNNIFKNMEGLFEKEEEGRAVIKIKNLGIEMWYRGLTMKDIEAV